jgi:hypothetical protein
MQGAQSHISSTPYAPMMGYSTMGDLSVSSRLLQPSLSPSVEELPPSKSVSKSKPSSTARPRQGHIVQLPTPISEHQRSARQRTAQDPSSVLASRTGATTNGERQVFIRRVQAVVEIPVKEESVDREVSEPVASASTSASASASKSSTSVPAPASRASKAPTRTAEPSKAVTRVKRKAPPKRAYVEIDDEDQSEADGNASEASQKSSAESGLSDSDGDDELLMGVEVS